MLKIEHLAVSYSGIRALQDVSLEVEQGEIVALVGANGAGKSTLLHTISGSMKPDQGTITFRGERIDRLPPHTILTKGIAQVPEGRLIFGDLTVLENLLAGAYTEKDKKKVADRLEKVYQFFPVLKDRASQRGGTMSGGQQQMLTIGRGLMSNPALLILDEPSLGVAPNLAHTILQTLLEFQREGMTILLIEQAVRDALTIADRGYVLQTGRIVTSDVGKVLLNSDLVRKAYLGM
jgi:branched-chain amino acid transport system ATP-binding protein